VSFQSLAAAHRVLGELFLRHQEALLDRDAPAALASLERYARALAAHMEAEDARILPLYRRLVTEPERGAAFALFDAEHRQLTDKLDGLFRALAHVTEAGLPRRGLIWLLERETQLKGLAEHHELREERHLLPALDALADADARRHALEGVWTAIEEV
jgi:hypothetical protein